MRKFTPALLVMVGLFAAGCGATTRTTVINQAPNPAFPAMTSATMAFVSQAHGKDKDSALTVQLLRNNAELAAEARVIGTKFDDYSGTSPLVFSVTGPFTTRDVDDGQVRVRLTPDGRDEWTFDAYLTMRFADGSSRNFVWRGVRLDNAGPERTLALRPARVG